jgi:2-polyprenyl-6-methoxyphenol hydroxylase-like FAD-dependent oxidoreductase
LSALLRQKGIKPQIVDRASDFAQAGYMLGLFPMGNRVLHGLGAFDAFVRRSEPMDTYALCNGHGETMQTFDIASALASLARRASFPAPTCSRSCAIAPPMCLSAWAPG